MQIEHILTSRLFCFHFENYTRDRSGVMTPVGFEQRMENVVSCVARQQKAFDGILSSNLFSHQSRQLIICSFDR